MSALLSRSIMDDRTFGPAFEKKIDGVRIGKQMARIKHFMLGSGWRTLAQIAQATGYPESSISAQLRHLRKKRFGSYQVEKERRENNRGTWQYIIREPIKDDEQVEMNL